VVGTDDETSVWAQGLQRRTFLKFAGAAGVVLTAESRFAGSATAVGNGPEVGPWQLPDGLPEPSFSTIIRRPDDLVRLRLDGYNLRVDRGPVVPRLVLIDPDRDVNVIVTFPPQALLEEALVDPAGNPAQGSLDARLAGPSRLGFVIPRQRLADGLRYDAPTLLDWSDWLLLAPKGARRAAGDPPPPPTPQPPFFVPIGVFRPEPPGPFDTSIEAPWRLQISPNRRAGFISQSRPFAGRTGQRPELWHARLATRSAEERPGGLPGELSEAPSPDRVIRAVWSPDPEIEVFLTNAQSADSELEPFRASMHQRDRISLVRLTTDEALPGSTTGPVPVPVDTLMLSALGATLDVGQSFADVDPDTGISIIEWRHRSTFARDQFVRIVERGYLMPFGHRAALVTITERKFVGTGANRTAVLELRKFLKVTQRVVDHVGPAAAGLPTDGRQLPFESVRLTTTVTPDLKVDGDALPGSGVPVGDCFFAVDASTGADVLFHATAVDRDGQRIDLRMPMAFINSTFAERRTQMATVRAAWNAYGVTARRSAQVSGQRVAYAAPLDQRRGATSATTDTIRFDLSPIENDALLNDIAGRRRFWADLAAAEVRLEEVESISANSLGSTTITYDPVYRASGFDPTVNAGGLWGTVGGAAGVPLRFSRPAGQESQPGPGSNKSGGVATPDLEIRGLSRSLGVAAGDPAALRTGTFDPASFFAGPASPKLLGGISLLDIIVPVLLPAGEPAPGTALSITSRRTPQAIEATLRWTPELQADPLGIFEPGTFRLDALVRTPLDGIAGTPSSRIDGELSSFSLNIPTGAVPLIRIDVDRVTFTSVDGREADTDVEVGDVSFGGDLAYIETLSKYLSFGTGGLEVDLLPDRIAVGLALPIPNITFGVFALRNVRFIAGLDIPFSGDPVRIRFALSTRDDPFRLTVLCIGGGGHVALAFGADGLETLELSLEAGAEVAIDLGVASGSVSTMIGVVLLLSKQDGVDTAEFLAYFRINGSVSAGPVSASITLTLELGYQERTKNGKTARTLYGRGTLEIDISVPLVPTPPITITFERSLKADAADPTFADQYDELAWNDYCDAYGAA
jgi:hypothetical protein